MIVTSYCDIINLVFIVKRLILANNDLSYIIITAFLNVIKVDC